MSPAVDPLEGIRRLYYGATKATIVRDLAQAIDLLKSMPDDEARERAAVYMDGLAQMRSEWGVRDTGSAPPGTSRKAARRPRRSP